MLLLSSPVFDFLGFLLFGISYYFFPCFALPGFYVGWIEDEKFSGSLKSSSQPCEFINYAQEWRNWLRSGKGRKLKLETARGNDADLDVLRVGSNSMSRDLAFQIFNKLISIIANILNKEVPPRLDFFTTVMLKNDHVEI
ncbi:hypothetical protein SUGI_0262100 [Cryptomeria japonica]|nr:hypothetical protein SUGI_0262100 [Cryptomeria japonica]